MLIGIIGKANCGKSTFFKASTLAEILIANYPFATIKPNHGIGYVKIDCVDKEFKVNCNPHEGFCIKNIRFVPIDLLDVAGLVPGAHMGRGMGNQFLEDLRPADLLIHVIDISGSTNEKGEPVKALSYDPLKDIKFLEEELDMWYFQILKKGWEKFVRSLQQEKKSIAFSLAKQLSALKVTEEIIKESIKDFSESVTNWTNKDLKKLASILRKKTKPIIIAANKIDVPGSEKNLEKIKKNFPEEIIIPCSAESELALREAAKKELISYIPGENHFEIPQEQKLKENQLKALDFINKNILKNFKSTGVQDILDTAVFKILKYIAVFPGGINNLTDSEGRVLPDCFLLPENSTALDFAYKLHTDFGKNFIRAINVKTKRTIGKDYILKNRDVIEIISGK